MASHGNNTCGQYQNDPSGLQKFHSHFVPCFHADHSFSQVILSAASLDMRLGLTGRKGFDKDALDLWDFQANTVFDMRNNDG